MVKVIKARYRQGRLEPMETLDIEEGTELTITVTYPDTEETSEADPTLATAGAWKELLDCRTFEKQVYQNRLVQTRPEVKL